MQEFSIEEKAYAAGVSVLIKPGHRRCSSGYRLTDKKALSDGLAGAGGILWVWRGECVCVCV